MAEKIKRLIDCGMSRTVALSAARRFSGREREFELYVEEIEGASNEPMEIL